MDDEARPDAIESGPLDVAEPAAARGSHYRTTASRCVRTSPEALRRTAKTPERTRWPSASRGSHEI